MPFKIVRNDITRVKADVIVNTANPNPICASGTDLAIYEAAGKEQLLAERAGIGKIARGDIAVTGAYNLKAKYIIHTVGPVWTDGKHHEFEILESSKPPSPLVFLLISPQFTATLGIPLTSPVL